MRTAIVPIPTASGRTRRPRGGRPDTVLRFSLTASSSHRFSPPLPFGFLTGTGGWRLQRTGRPIGSARPSLRVDPDGSSTTYCIRPTTTPKPEQWERALLTHGPPRRGSPAGFSVAPPAPSARDSTQGLRFTPPSRPVRPRSDRARPAVGLGPVRSRPGPPAQLTTSRLLSFSFHGTTSAPGGTSPFSTYFHKAINSFRAAPRSPPSAPARCHSRTACDTTRSGRYSADTAAIPTTTGPAPIAPAGSPPC